MAQSSLVLTSYRTLYPLRGTEASPGRAIFRGFFIHPLALVFPSAEIAPEAATGGFTAPACSCQSLACGISPALTHWDTAARLTPKCSAIRDWLPNCLIRVSICMVCAV